MFDDLRHEMMQTYLIEGVRAVAFVGCFGLIAAAIWVFGG